LQAGWCFSFGFFAFHDGYRVLKLPSADLDCFLSLGTYSVCSTTIFLSVSSSLLFLMAQAFMSRVLVPGVSIFVNASVRCPLQYFSQFRITTLQPKHHQSIRAQLKASHVRRRFWTPTGNQPIQGHHSRICETIIDVAVAHCNCDLVLQLAGPQQAPKGVWAQAFA
jgi:hypothetical protein